MTTTCTKCGQVHTGCTGHISSGDRKGQPCRKPCRPGEVCTAHGGRAPQVKAAQERRRQEAAAAEAVATLGLPIDISPTDALLQEVQWTAGHVQWLRRKVAELDDQGLVWGTTRTETEMGASLQIDVKDGAVAGVGSAPANKVIQTAAPSLWYDLYERERKHLVNVCAAALKAGVEERRVRLAEQQGDLVAEVIRRILDALNLTDEQQALVPTIVPRELRVIAGGAA